MAMNDRQPPEHQELVERLAREAGLVEAFPGCDWMVDQRSEGVPYIGLTGLRRFAALVAAQCAAEAARILRGGQVDFVAEHTGTFSHQELLAQAVDGSIRAKFKEQS